MMIGRANIRSGIMHPSGGGGMDADAVLIIADLATRGFTAPSLTQTAINAFIVTCKSIGAWPYFINGSLVIGGTAAAHALDFVNHGNDCIASFVGSPTHNSGGMQGNGVNQYYIWNKIANLYDALDVAIDLGVGTTNAASVVDFGSFGTTIAFAPTFFQLNASDTSNSGNGIVSTQAAGILFNTGVTDSKGVHSIERTSDSLLRYYYRGVKNGEITALIGCGLNIYEPYGMARNNLGSPVFYSDRQQQFVLVRRAMPEATVIALHAAIYQLQSDLGRAPY